MAVPSPSEADAVSARVHLVADMLLQKAHEVQSKGNAGAAQALHDSAADLQRAVAVLHELARHVHTSTAPAGLVRRDSELSLVSLASMSTTAPIQSEESSHRHAPPHASSSVKDLVAKLARVEAMLAKKSDEMKAKGNDGAAHALQQSALAVRLGAQHIGDQQKMTRTLVVTARTLREQLREQYRVVLVDEELGDDAPLDDELRQRAVDRVGELVAWRNAIQSVLPSVATVEELREALSRLEESPAQSHGGADHWEEQCGRLQQQIDETKRELEAAQKQIAEGTNAQSAEVERAMRESNKRRERELEQLRGVHASELDELLQAKAAEAEALLAQVESWKKQAADQRDALAERQAQHGQDAKVYEREIAQLQEQVSVKERELREAVSQHAADELREQLEESRRREHAVAQARDAAVAEAQALKAALAQRSDELARSVAAGEASARETAARVEELTRESQRLGEELRTLRGAAAAETEALSKERQQGGALEAAITRLTLLVKEDGQLEGELGGGEALPVVTQLWGELTQWSTRRHDIHQSELAAIILELRAILQSADTAVPSAGDQGEEEGTAWTSLAGAVRGCVEHLVATVQSLSQQIERLQSTGDEGEELRSRVAEVEGEFERYRLRSHAALKKVEKRAELLNGLRKEKEEAERRLGEVQTQCEEAERRGADAVAQLREKAEELEKTAATVAAVEAKFATLTAEKEAVEEAARVRGEQLAGELAAKEAEVEEIRQRLEELQRVEEEASMEREKAVGLLTEMEMLRARVIELEAEVELKGKEVRAAEGRRVEMEEQLRAAGERVLALEEEGEQLRDCLATLKDSRTQDSQAKEQQIARLNKALGEEKEGRRASTQGDDEDQVEALHRTIQGLRRHIMEIESKSGQKEGSGGETEEEGEELARAQVERAKKREKYAEEMAAAKRREQVAAFLHRTRSTVEELQGLLEEYSSAFRDACAVTGELAEEEEEEGSTAKEEEDQGEPEFEEYLTFNSGVVIKAGATFTLPVFCERPGWRVVWRFSVKEDAADVGFRLRVGSSSSSFADEGEGSGAEIVAPARVHELAGQFDAPAAATQLAFEWDNTFSWLNEKTLDYHVSVLEPLTGERRTQRAAERTRGTQRERLRERVSRLASEKDRRQQLEQAVAAAAAFEDEQASQIHAMRERGASLLATRGSLQAQMEGLQQQLSAMVKELDELADDERQVHGAGDQLRSELEDVGMTLTLSASSRLDAVLAALLEQSESEEQ